MKAVAIDPTHPATLYAGVQDKGVYRSTDGGGVWARTSAGLGDVEVAGLAVDPLVPERVYACVSGHGFYRSIDSGAHWSPIDSSLQTQVKAIAFAPGAVGKLFVATQVSVLVSTDAGDTWSDIGAGTFPSGADALAIDASKSERLYAGTSAGVYRSTDAGNSWAAPSVVGPATSVKALVVDPANSATLYAGVDGGGLARSTDFGVTWAARGSGLPNSSILQIDPLSPATLYAAGGSGPRGMGVFRSTDGGDTWTASATGLESSIVMALAIDPSHPSNLFAATSLAAALYRSTDGGTSWQPANGGILAIDPWSVAVHPTDSGTVFVGTNVGGLFRSSNSGESFSSLAGGQPDSGLGFAISPTVPDTVYSVRYGGVSLSTDRGDSWTEVNGHWDGGRTGIPTALMPQSVAVDPVDPATAYVGTYFGGLYKTVTSGDSWTLMSLPVVNIHAIALLPSNRSIVYAATSSGVFKSTDAGASWASATSGMTNSLVMQLALDSAVPATLYVGTWGGIFKSTNGGSSWMAASNGLGDVNVTALAIHPVLPSTLYAGTYADGVYRSTDAGATWTRVPGLPPAANVRALAIDPRRHSTVYAAVAGSSVWEYIAASALRFMPVAPCRAFDTRDPVGPLGGPAVPGLGIRSVALAGVCGIPPGAEAVSGNVTVVPPPAPGSLRLHAADAGVPSGTTMYYAAGRTRANNGVFGLSLDSTQSLVVRNEGSAPAEVILDVNGYFQ